MLPQGCIADPSILHDWAVVRTVTVALAGLLDVKVTADGTPLGAAVAQEEGQVGFDLPLSFVLDLPLPQESDCQRSCLSASKAIVHVTPSTVTEAEGSAVGTFPSVEPQ